MIRRHLATVVCAGGYLLIVAAAVGILIWSEIQHGDAPDANLGGIWLVIVGLPWSILGVALPESVAAIGILAGHHTSWLDVQLEPGRYLGACMLPFSTGYPHAMDGMYRFFDVE